MVHENCEAENVQLINLSYFFCVEKLVGIVKACSVVDNSYCVLLFCLYCPVINLHNLHEEFKSSKTSTNFIDFTLFPLCVLISNLGNKKERPSFLLGLWTREYIVFSNVKREFLCLKPFINFMQISLARENK